MKYLGLLVLLFACSKTPAPETPPPFVKVQQAVVADVPIFNEYVGHVEANQTANIKSQAEGTITGQFFVEGQEVQAGDLLLTIDPSPFQATLDRMVSILSQNIATLRQAQDTQQRYAKLVKDEYISKLDYDRYVTNVMTAEASVQEAKADVERAQIDLDYCTIKAPFTGITSKLLINVGNYVPVGGDPLLTLNQITPIRVSYFVPEKDLPKIAALHLQTPLTTTVAINGETVEGNLFLIDNKVDENTGTILLQSLFQNETRKLWPGEFVDVKLILEVKKNAVIVPTQAIQLGQEGTYVFVLKQDQTVELRKVKTGQKNGETTLIESGVEGGESVVIEGQLNLKSGCKVSVS